MTTTTKPCLNVKCGGTFRASRSDADYCSQACKQAAYRDRHRVQGELDHIWERCEAKEIDCLTALRYGLAAFRGELQEVLDEEVPTGRRGLPASRSSAEGCGVTGTSRDRRFDVSDLAGACGHPREASA